MPTRQFYQAKSKEDQGKVQFQLELSLAKLSPSLFFFCVGETFIKLWLFNEGQECILATKELIK